MRVCPECHHRTEHDICPRDRAMTIDEALLASGRDPFIGRLVADRYRLIDLLGKGGMGRVYAAEQVAMRRRVAVKVIRSSTFDDGQALRSMTGRFQREVYAASRLQHPNTIRVFDFGSTEDGAMYLVMEYRQGRTLDIELKRNDRLEPRRMLRIAAQVCWSLVEAHDNGIIHRDLKPANIFLTEVAGDPDFVKVLDFGIAKVLEGTSDLFDKTKTGAVLGTPVYMAPEQGAARPVTPATDLYSLGVILFHGLCGRPPFQGDTPLAVMLAHAQNPVPQLVVDGFPPDISPALEAYVRRLLDKDPDRRPAPAARVAADLQDLLGGCDAVPPASAGGAAPGTRAVPETEPTRILEDTATTSRAPRPKRHGAGTRLLVVGAAVAAGMALGLWAHSHKPLDEEPLPGVSTSLSDVVPDTTGDRVDEPEVVRDHSTRDDLLADDVAMLPPAAPSPPKARPLPRCASLTCPFPAPCTGDRGERTTGRDYCFRSLPPCSRAWCDSGQGTWCRDPTGRNTSRAEFCRPPLPLCTPS